MMTPSLGARARASLGWGWKSKMLQVDKPFGGKLREGSGFGRTGQPRRGTGDPGPYPNPTVTHLRGIRSPAARQAGLVCGVAGGLFSGPPWCRALGGSFNTVTSGGPWSCALRGNVHGQNRALEQWAGSPGGLLCCCFLVPALPSGQQSQGSETVVCQHRHARTAEDTHTGQEGLAAPQEAGAVLGGDPCSGGEDTEALGCGPGSCGPSCPTSLCTPTHVWAPRHGTRSFLCAGARLLEKRPAVWEQGRRVQSWGSC